jgi:hypothetical protein
MTRSKRGKGRSPKLPPVYNLPPDDVERSGQAWSKTNVAHRYRALIGSINAALDDAMAESGSYVADLLNRGGTLQWDHMTRIPSGTAEPGRRLSQDVDALKLAVSGIIDAPVDRATLKSYGRRKTGLGPHRDSNFDGERTAKVASLTTRGVGRFCLWVLPESCQVDNEVAMTMRDVDMDRPLIVEVDGRERSLYPVQGITVYPGDMITIDETPGIGTWEGPDGYTELWHSARTVDDRQPRHAILLRSNNVTSDRVDNIAS